MHAMAGVNREDACAYASSYTEGATQILCPYGASQTIGCIIRQAHRFFFVLEGDDADYGAKNLFPRHTHLIIDIHQHSGLHEIALLGPNVATTYYLRALFSAQCNIVERALSLCRRDEWANLAGLAQWLPHDQSGCATIETCAELLIN